MMEGSIFMEGVSESFCYGIKPTTVWKHLPRTFRPHSKNRDGLLQSYWVRASTKVRYRKPFPYLDTVPKTFRPRDLGTFEYPTFLVGDYFVNPRRIEVVGPWSRYQARFRLLERMYQKCIHIKRSFPMPPSREFGSGKFVTYTRISL